MTMVQIKLTIGLDHSSSAVETITLPNQTLGTGNHTLSITCSAPNVDQNNSNNDQMSNFDIIPNGQSVTIEIVNDCYGSEVLGRNRSKWEYFNSRWAI